MRRVLEDGGAAHQTELLARLEHVADAQIGVDGAEVHVADAVAVEGAADDLGDHHGPGARRAVVLGEVVDAAVAGDHLTARQLASAAHLRAVAVVGAAVAHGVVLGARQGHDARCGHGANRFAQPGSRADPAEIESAVLPATRADVVEVPEDAVHGVGLDHPRRAPLELERWHPRRANPGGVELGARRHAVPARVRVRPRRERQRRRADPGDAAPLPRLRSVEAPGPLDYRREADATLL